MPRITTLSRSDEDFLKRFIESERRNMKNRVSSISTSPLDLPSPEVYLAFTPADGIPALNENITGTGTGSWPADDAPGSAECQIWRVIEDVPVNANFSKVLYNFSTTAIVGHTWVKAIRDKWGTWFAVPTATVSGGGASSSFSGCGTSGATLTSVGAFSEVTLNLGSQIYDTDGYFPATTLGNFGMEVPTNGYYRIIGFAEENTGTFATYGAYMRLGDDSVSSKQIIVAASRYSSSAPYNCCGVLDVDLQAGDEVRLRVYNDHSSALNWKCRMSIERLLQL